MNSIINTYVAQVAQFEPLIKTGSNANRNIKAHVKHFILAAGNWPFHNAHIVYIWNANQNQFT